MTVDTVVTGREADYVGQTQGRIAQISQALEGLRQGNLEDLNRVIGQLQEQERASQEAQFTGIARVTRDMIACLQWSLGVQRPLTTGAVDALLDACQCIVLHAEAVAAGVFSESQRHARRLQSDACGASPSPEHTDDQPAAPSEVFLRRRSRRPRTATGEEAFPSKD